MTRHQAQGRTVEAGRSKRLCEEAIQDWNRRGIIGSKKINVAQSEGGGCEGSRNTSGDG